jgi:putative ABC transport system permease protein
MISQVLRVAWYRLRPTFGRRWGGYLGLVLLIGLVGGVALGTGAAARRTESSFPVFLASTNPSDVTVQYASSYYAGLPAFARTVARLPHVRRAEIAVGLIADVLGPDGAPTDASRASGFGMYYVGSVDGLYFNQDRVAVIRGRIADPRRPDQVMMNAAAASLLGLHVGDVVPMGFYTNAQASSPAYGTPRVRPVVQIEASIVGLVEFNTSVVQDDIDRPQGDLLLTPALTGALLKAGTSGGISWYGLQLDHGAGGVAAVEREINGQAGNGGLGGFKIASVNEEQAQGAIEPDWIALFAFALVAALTALLIAVQAIARLVRADADDMRVLNALGASRMMAASDCLPGILGSVVLGSLLAVGVAALLSPLAPIGPVRPVYPFRGVAFDWTVLGSGFLALVGCLGVAAVTLAFRSASRRGRPAAPTGARGSAAGRLAAASGLPTPAVAGIHFAFGPGKGGTTAPVRSAISGTVLAVVMVVATLTFGSSLATLVSHPPLYGWNWTYALWGSQGPTAVPQQQVASSLRSDPDVAAWTTVAYVTANLDGQAVPVLLGSPHAAVAPPVLSGHQVDGGDQIVLGPATLAQIHQHLGGTVSFSVTGPGVTLHARLTIVGTATMPTVGLSDVLHTSMGTGALVSDQLLPPVASGCNGPPDMTLVRLRPGVGAVAGLASMRHVASGTNTLLARTPVSNPCHGDYITVLPVQRPAQIANYRSMGAAPAVLAFGLAAGAVAALGLTLVASVRRRRRDLAVLKAIGFTRRQVAATVAWQATVAAAIGIVVGVPLGVALGRWLWTLFARQIYAVPEPTVPVGSLVLVSLCTLILVNLVAALPGRAAARTPAALALRTE